MHLRLASCHERFEQQAGRAPEDFPPELARLLQDVRPEWLDMPPGVFQPPAACRIAARVAGRDGDGAVVLEPSNRRGVGRRQTAARVTIRIAGVGPGNCAE